jgi:hypothetical protein
MLGSFILVVALLVAALAVGFFVSRLRRDRRQLTQPLASIAGLYGRFLVLYVVLVLLDYGFSGGGLRGSVCVNTGYPYGGAAQGFAARPGASLSVAGDVRACALHPSIGQMGPVPAHQAARPSPVGLPATADLAADQGGEHQRPVHAAGGCHC